MNIEHLKQQRRLLDELVEAVDDPLKPGSLGVIGSVANLGIPVPIETKLKLFELAIGTQETLARSRYLYSLWEMGGGLGEEELDESYLSWFYRFLEDRDAGVRWYAASILLESAGLSIKFVKQDLDAIKRLAEKESVESVREVLDQFSQYLE